MEEIWKDIQGYENQYQISNFGRVRSLDRIDSRGWKRKGKIMKLCVKEDGYSVIGLTKNNYQKKFLVHRLVAEAFLKKTNETEEVNHIDENKQNNNVNNLEWCSHLKNMHHTQSLRPKFMISKKPKKRIGKINQYSIEGEFIKTWDSVMDIERSIGLNADCIWSCCKRGHKSQGYIWSFAN